MLYRRRLRRDETKKQKKKGVHFGIFVQPVKLIHAILVESLLFCEEKEIV